MNDITDRLNNLRIGYVPVSQDLKYPTDRRLFCHYAKKRNINYEIATVESKYDILIIPQQADLTVWRRVNENTKIIFIFENSYLSVDKSNIKNRLRGAAKFLTRQHKYLETYSNSLVKMCQRASTVICATKEQSAEIEPYCKNIHVFSAFQENATKKRKELYSTDNIFKIVWEGLPSSIGTFQVIMQALTEIEKKYNISIHLITDIKSFRWLNKIGETPTKKIIEKTFTIKNVYLYEWNEDMLSSICTSADLAIIPIPLDDPLYVGKPENKLLLFWKMGIPTITSATPAYVRAMEQCGLSMTCTTMQDWINTIEYYIVNEEDRRKAGEQGIIFTKEKYNEDILLKHWDEMFISIAS